MGSPPEQPDVRGDALSGLGERRKEGRGRMGSFGLRAYPNNPAHRYVMMAQTR